MGGQPVVNFFRFLNTYGLPLEIVLSVFKREGIVPDWTGFFRESVEHGRSPDRVQLELEETIGDVFGKEYREHFSLMMTNWRRLIFHQ